MRRFLKITLFIVVIPVVTLVLLIGYATLSDYRPGVSELLPGNGSGTDTIPDSAQINVLIWNIGYCGLDSQMDFFYDGGRGVRTSPEQLKLNYAAVSRFLLYHDSADILLLQEVDTDSKRSYHLNEVEKFSALLGDFSSFYGKNYDVSFVPLPPASPMGSVNSGLLSMSRFTPSSATRFAFPGQYAWPKQLFMLDRCFLVLRFPMRNGRELLVINTHNEAYDDGSIRDEQMAYLKEFLLSEYRKGNYVLTGGDWNQCPPDFTPAFHGEVYDTINNKGIDANYLPDDWLWIYDAHTPSNRRLDIPYTKGKTMTTVIDFYLLSPNINMLSVNTIDLGFGHSDHHPVSICIKLK